MPWSSNKIGIRLVFLLTTVVFLAVSDEPSEEKSYYTAESCDSDEPLKAVDGTVEESEYGPDLSYSCVSPNLAPEEETPVVFLHGLLDSKDTWYGLYQNIPVLTHRKACIYDARNHGDSGWNDTLNIGALAEDLGRFINKLKIERAVLVGHSMGGLTAMQFALSNPSKVDRLLVEDISPIRIPKSAMTYVVDLFNVMKKCVSVIPEGADENTAKNTVVDYFREVTHESLPKAVSAYLPIHQRDGVWQWKANFDVIQKALVEPDKAFNVKLQGRYTGKTLFIYGKSSSLKVDDDEEDILKYFPNAEFFGVKDAQHDIHIEYREFETQLIKFLE